MAKNTKRPYWNPGPPVSRACYEVRTSELKKALLDLAFAAAECLAAQAKVDLAMYQSESVDNNQETAMLAGVAAIKANLDARSELHNCIDAAMAAHGEEPTESVDYDLHKKVLEAEIKGNHRHLTALRKKLERLHENQGLVYVDTRGNNNG